MMLRDMPLNEALALVFGSLTAAYVLVEFGAWRVRRQWRKQG